MVGRSGRLAVYSPEFGSVEAAVWLVFLGVVVWRASVALVETVRVVAPDVPAVPVRALPWLLLAVVVLGVAARELRRHRADNPHEFLAREVRSAFLAQRRPGLRQFLRSTALTVTGAAAVYRARDGFFTALDGFLFLAKRFLERGTLVEFSPVNLALGVAFLVGVGLLARGLDRLLVGLVREAQFRRYRRADRQAAGRADRQ